MYFLLDLIDLAYHICVGIIIVQVAVTWLIAFDVINTSNEQARNLVDLLRRVTDPVYKPIQKYVPPIGGIDITPLIVILALALLRDVLVKLIF